MANIERRLSRLEDALSTHLTESGEIRVAIKELQKSLENVSQRMWGAAVFSIATLVAAVGFLLKVMLWK